MMLTYAEDLSQLHDIVAIFFLLQGKLTVRFMDSTIDLQDFSRTNIYEMVETTAYFEAYNPILEGLQQTTNEDLPFQVICKNAQTDEIITR